MYTYMIHAMYSTANFALSVYTTTRMLTLYHITYHILSLLAPFCVNVKVIEDMIWGGCPI